MQRIRRGNDIKLVWSIFNKDGTPHSLVGKDINIILRNYLDKEEIISNLSIADNVATFDFLGKDQTVLGGYTLILTENDQLIGMHTVDKVNAFQLVGNSCQEGGVNFCNRLKIHTVNLVSETDIGAKGDKGDSAYEIAVQNGFVGTEEDWLESLHGSDAEVTAENIINALGYTPAKITQKTTSEWNSLPNYLPENGEVIVYSDYRTIEENNETRLIPGIKIGTGNGYAIDLPFVDDYINDILSQHISDNDRHLRSQERSFWNAKLNVDDNAEIYDETLIFNRN